MRRDLPPLPPAMKNLPLDKRGFPVPWFASWPIAKRDVDFQVIEPGRIVTAMRFNVCWVSGEEMDPVFAFVIGPMCAINRISAEPPSRIEVAEWSVKGCPLLSNPAMRRAPRSDVIDAPGIMERRNPGVSLIWVCDHFSPVRVDGGYLFQVPDPMWVSWWHRGREATRAEVEAAMAPGVAQLRQMAMEEGSAALNEFSRRLTMARELLPEA